jgi:hypothetical protein
MPTKKPARPDKPDKPEKAQLHAGQVLVSATTPTRILAANPRRVSVHLVDARNLYLGGDDTVSATTGFASLEQTLILSSPGALWALAKAEGMVAFLEETK